MRFDQSHTPGAGGTELCVTTKAQFLTNRFSQLSEIQLFQEIQYQLIIQVSHVLTETTKGTGPMLTEKTTMTIILMAVIIMLINFITELTFIAIIYIHHHHLHIF